MQRFRGPVKALCSATIMLVTSVAVTAQPNVPLPQDVQHAMQVIRTLCGTESSRKELEVKGDVGVKAWFRNLVGAEVSGSGRRTTEELRGIATQLQQQTSAASVQLSKEQIACMQPFIQQLLEMLKQPARYQPDPPPPRPFRSSPHPLSIGGIGLGASVDDVYLKLDDVRPVRDPKGNYRLLGRVQLSFDNLTLPAQAAFLARQSLVSQIDTRVRIPGSCENSDAARTVAEATSRDWGRPAEQSPTRWQGEGYSTVYWFAKDGLVLGMETLSVIGSSGPSCEIMAQYCAGQCE
jgi:hypothetical protein